MLGLLLVGALAAWLIAVWCVFVLIRLVWRAARGGPRRSPAD